MDRYFAQTPVDVRAVMVQREKDRWEKEEKERQERERQERVVGVGGADDGETEKKGKGGTFSDDESDGSCDAKMGEGGQEEGGDRA